MGKHYWGFRIDTRQIAYFRSELDNGRLRIGWGWDSGQDLRVMTVDSGARGNMPIFRKVKKGDILVIPRLPSWGEVAIAEATADFDAGYSFAINADYGDYGHVFPAVKIKQFMRNSEKVKGIVRSSLKRIPRFWCLDNCGHEIEEIIAASDSDLRDKVSFANRFNNLLHDSFNESFNTTKFNQELYRKATESFSNEEWEYALVEGLKTLFPKPIDVQRTGGITESEHGTDIVIRIPGLLNYQYVIAIQVKDYHGCVSNNPIAQLNKADKYWNSDDSRLIDKILVITKSDRGDNVNFLKECEAHSIRVVFAKNLSELLSKIGMQYIGMGRE